MPTGQSGAAQGLTVTMADGVAEISIDRPSRKNAITLAMWQALGDMMDRLSADPSVRVIVLRGAGADFSAGADISEFETERGDEARARNYEAANSRSFKAVRNAAVPVVAAIRGICFGGGFGLAAAADLRIATPDASFAVPAARLGLAYPADAMTDILTSAGPQMARYLTYCAERISAARALACGFLLEIVEPDQFDQRVSVLARTIASNAPLSIKASKLAIAATLAGDAELSRIAQAAGDATFGSVDYAEGRAAFLQRRTPRFSGR